MKRKKAIRLAIEELERIDSALAWLEDQDDLQYGIAFKKMMETPKLNVFYNLELGAVIKTAIINALKLQRIGAVKTTWEITGFDMDEIGDCSKSVTRPVTTEKSK